MNYDQIMSEHEDPKAGVTTIVKLLHEATEEERETDEALTGLLIFCGKLYVEDPVLTGVVVTAFQNAGTNVAKLVLVASQLAKEDVAIKSLLEGLKRQLKEDGGFREAPIRLFVEIAEELEIEVQEAVKAILSPVE